MISNSKIDRILEMWYDARQKNDIPSENYAVSELRTQASINHHSFSIFQVMADYEKQRQGVKEIPALTTVKGEFECDECERTFATQNALNGHKRVHQK